LLIIAMRSQQIGLYRQRISLQAQVETKDSYGQPVKSWQTIQSFAAEVRFLRGQELINVAQKWATATHIISCRWQGASFDPQATMRVMLGKDGRIFNVLNFQNVEERNRQCIFTCEERVT
jgi:SPP1 family predicted phage head-tail adaptor